MLFCLVRQDRFEPYICCFKLVQGFRVTCLFTGHKILKVMEQLQMLYSEWLDHLLFIVQYSECLDQDLVGWIQASLLPQSLAWLLGYGTNHSLLFIVQYWPHHIETRQIQYCDDQTI